MEPSLETLILDQLKELRDELHDFRSDIQKVTGDGGERTTRLETQMKDVYGNGHPGRLSKLEEAVDELTRNKYWVLGVSASISCIFAVVTLLIKIL
jgi:hypothetical protein